MIFLTILGVTEILILRLVLEGKTGKEITESLKLSSNNFTLSNAEDNTLRPLNRGGIANLSLLKHY